MKKMIGITCVVIIMLASAAPTLASSENDPAVVAGDALVVRPLSFAATVIGSAVFVVSLPIAAISGSVHSAADALVGQPGRFTFQRHLGDFEYWPYHDEDQPVGKKMRGAKVVHLKAPKDSTR